MKCYWLLCFLAFILPVDQVNAKLVYPQGSRRINAEKSFADASVLYRKGHRYTGKIGKASVTVWLDVDSLPRKKTQTDFLSCNGYYYYNKYRQAISLRVQQFEPGKPLLLEEQVIDKAGNKPIITGYFKTDGPPGSSLSGTWLSADKKRSLPFKLQENYAGAVKYREINREVTGKPCPDGGVETDTKAIYSLGYLDIRFPENPKVESLLRKKFSGPRPEAQMAAYLKKLVQTDEYGCQELSESVQVTYNADHIFSVENHDSFHGYGALRFYHEFGGVNINLLTGQELSLQDLLKPAYKTDDYIPDLKESETDVADNGAIRYNFTIGPSGLNFYVKTGANVSEVFVPYSDIQHLIRPDGPLKYFIFQPK